MNNHLQKMYMIFDRPIKIYSYSFILYTVPESEEEFRGYLTEYLFFTKEGLAFMKDIKFSGFPFGDYNITVSC